MNEPGSLEEMKKELDLVVARRDKTVGLIIANLTPGNNNYDFQSLEILRSFYSRYGLTLIKTDLVRNEPPVEWDAVLLDLSRKIYEVYGNTIFQLILPPNTSNPLDCCP